jgi:hypothetical protein
MKALGKIFLVFFSSSLLLQTAVSQDTGPVTDTVKTGEPEAISDHSLYTGAGIGSNMIYLGSTISRNRPYEYASVSYGFKNALFASVSGIHLGNVSPFVAFYSFSINYNQVVNSWFDISATASRYQVPSSLTDSLFNSFNYADLTLGFDWKILYTRISVGGIISNTGTGYYQISNSRYFETPGFGKKELTFSFDPYVNLLFGKLTTAKSTTGTTVTATPPFRTPGGGGGNGGGGGGSGTSTVTYTTKTGLMETDFGVAISLNAPRFTIEAEPGYTMPLYEDPEYPGVEGFVVILSCFIKIF